MSETKTIVAAAAERNAMPIDPAALELAKKVILAHLPPHQAERFWPSAAKDLARAYLDLVSKAEAVAQESEALTRHNAADAARAASPRVSDGEAGRIARAASTATVAGTSEARVREIAQEEIRDDSVALHGRIDGLAERLDDAEHNAADIDRAKFAIEAMEERLNALEAAAQPRPSFNPKPLHPPPAPTLQPIERDTYDPPTCTGCADRIPDSDYHSCVPSEPGSDETVPQKMGRGAPAVTAEERADAVLICDVPLVRRDAPGFDDRWKKAAVVQIRAAEVAARRKALEDYEAVTAALKFYCRAKALAREAIKDSETIVDSRSFLDMCERRDTREPILARALLASEAEVERLKAKWHEYDEASGLDYDDFDGDDAAWDEHVERAHAAYHAMKAAAIAPPPGAPTP